MCGRIPQFFSVHDSQLRTKQYPPYNNPTQLYSNPVDLATLFYKPALTYEPLPANQKYFPMFIPFVLSGRIYDSFNDLFTRKTIVLPPFPSYL
jgi:hypothetical protein